MTQANFEKLRKNKKDMTKNEETMSRHTEASINNLEMHIFQLSRKLAAQPSSTGGFYRNTIYIPKN